MKSITILLAEMNSAAGELGPVNSFLDNYRSELVILTLFAMVIVTLFVLVPQLLRSHLRKTEMQHEEYMKSLENGIAPPVTDEATKAAGRATMLVPMVVIICAGTVTCFMVAYKSTDLFAVGLSVWAVAGVVSLAAITGGVALIGRLAQLHTGTDDEVPRNPLED